MAVAAHAAIRRYAAMICRGSAPASVASAVLRAGELVSRRRVQMLFITWIYGEQNQVRPMFPPDTSQEDLIRVSKSFDLAPQLPPVDWSKALLAPARPGHPQGGRWPARHLCRPDAGRDRRRA